MCTWTYVYKPSIHRSTCVQFQNVHPCTQTHRTYTTVVSTHSPEQKYTHAPRYRHHHVGDQTHTHLPTSERKHTCTSMYTELLIVPRHLWILLLYFEVIFEFDLCSPCVLSGWWDRGLFHSHHWAPTSQGEGGHLSLQREQTLSLEKYSGRWGWRSSLGPEAWFLVLVVTA